MGLPALQFPNWSLQLPGYTDTVNDPDGFAHDSEILRVIQGAGKTTFITRFFRSVLDPKILSASVVLRVDLREQSGDVADVVQWLDAELIKEAEGQLFEDAGPTFREIQGMFYDEYVRLSRGAWSPIYESDDTHVQFHIRFGEMVEDMRKNRKGDYLRGVMRHIVANRKQLPILVFDNADHFDISFQQSVYQYARSVYEQEVCLVILPVTKRTSWQLSKHGALQSFEHEAFFLPAPRTSDIIRKRIDFIDRKVELDRVVPDDRYRISGNLSLSIKDLSTFTRVLQRVFLQTSNVSDWIGDLANHDVRRALDLARNFIGSPHLRVNDLVSAYLGGSAVTLPAARAIKALVRQKYDIYPVGINPYVQNIYALNIELATTPLLGVRMLQLLSDVTPDERRNALVDVDRVEAYFIAMGIEDRAVRLWLDQLLKAGLILDYDPTTQSIDVSRQVELSPAGRQHLLWGLREFQYVSAMAEVTPLLSEPLFAELTADARSGSDWHHRTAKFVQYLLDEDQHYCTVPVHEAYDSQRRLTSTVKSLQRTLCEWKTQHRLVRQQ